MAENRYCSIHLRNETGGVLNKTGEGLSRGKWTTSPPTQIGNSMAVNFKATGAKGSATGAQGSVTYMLPNGKISFEIYFHIPYSSANSGGIVVINSGGVVNPYRIQQTDSTFTETVSFPSRGHQVTVYFYVGQLSNTGDLNVTSWDGTVLDTVSGLSDQAKSDTTDIVTVARHTPPGDYSRARVIELFDGKLTASLAEVLDANVPALDKMSFVIEQDLISSKVAFESAIEFADHSLPALETSKAHASASAVMSALRKLSAGTQAPDLGQNIQKLEEAKAISLLYHKNQEVAAIEAILACIYMAPHAALLQAGSCARQVAEESQAYQIEIAWQFNCLKEKIRESLS